MNKNINSDLLATFQLTKDAMIQAGLAVSFLCCLLYATQAVAQTAQPLDAENFFSHLQETSQDQHQVQHRCDVSQKAIQARTQWHRLSAGAQASITPWVTRPTSGVGSGAYSNAASTYDSAHFRVHYIDKNLFPNDADAAYFMVVQKIVAALEQSWHTDHKTLGYALPPSDVDTVNNGGNALYDIYLKDVGKFGLLGYTTSDVVGTNDPSRPHGTFSFIIMDNDFSYQEYGYLDPSILIKATAAHEYFHAVQFGYDPSEQVALAEQSATWIEDKVFPKLHDNYNYIGEVYVDSNGNGQFDATESFTDRNLDGKRNGGSQNSPERALDAFDPQGDIQYGRFLWLRFLSENFGDLIIRDIWQQAATVAGDNTYAAINDALLARGSSLQQAYQDYALWAYQVERFVYGANYPRAWVEKTFMSEVMNVSSNTLNSLQAQQSQEHFSSIYIQVYNPAGDYIFSAYSGLAALSVIMQHANGSMSTEHVMMNANQATWVAPSTCVRAVFVVSNVSEIHESMVWSMHSSQRGNVAVADTSAKGVATTVHFSPSSKATLNDGIRSTQQDFTVATEAAKKAAGCFLPSTQSTFAGAWLIPLFLLALIAWARKRA